ncbi:MAG: hypothetical protein IKU73_01980 [Clostridia bacterium]|nr:hypothetical protein [Clostridia bacterium]
MNNRTHQEQAEIAPAQENAAEITAQELGAQMMQGAQREEDAEIRAMQQEQEELLEQVRQGIGELFEDGWTAQELAAFSQDRNAQEAIAGGHSVARAACAYLRRNQNAVRRRGVPTARTIAAGAFERENPIEGMTDEQFDAFSRRAQAAMMQGRKVRI